MGNYWTDLIKREEQLKLMEDSIKTYKLVRGKTAGQTIGQVDDFSYLKSKALTALPETAQEGEHYNVRINAPDNGVSYLGFIYNGSEWNCVSIASGF